MAVHRFHHDRVAVVRFVVQRHPGLQLARVAVDHEGTGVETFQYVGKTVVLSVLGIYGVAHVLPCFRVFGHLPGRCRARERGRVVGPGPGNADAGGRPVARSLGVYGPHLHVVIGSGVQPSNLDTGDRDGSIRHLDPSIFRVLLVPVVVVGDGGPPRVAGRGPSHGYAGLGVQRHRRDAGRQRRFVRICH